MSKIQARLSKLCPKYSILQCRPFICRHQANEFIKKERQNGKTFMQIVKVNKSSCDDWLHLCKCAKFKSNVLAKDIELHWFELNWQLDPFGQYAQYMHFHWLGNPNIMISHSLQQCSNSRDICAAISNELFIAIMKCDSVLFTLPKLILGALKTSQLHICEY